MAEPTVPIDPNETPHTAVGHAHVHAAGTAHAVVASQMLGLLVIVGTVLYTALFSTYPPLHDALHELRHTLYLIPCH